MRFATLDDGRLVVVTGQDVRYVNSVPAGCPDETSAMRRLLHRWGREGLSGIEPDGDRVDIRTVRFGPPVPDPGKIYAAPVNYVDHQQEMNESVQVSGLGLFLKAPTSVVGHQDDVRLPYSGRRFDQEGEVAVVIGRTARNVSEAEALDYVFGVTGLLDMTMRGHEDRSTRKSFETFTPMGPWIITLDEVPDIENIAFTCRVNGAIRQQARTSSLIWGIAKLVSYASSITTLEPGDVITSGTPAGVGPVTDGDVITLTFDELDLELSVQVSDEGATDCPTGVPTASAASA